MTRQLRARRARPSYAALINLDSDEDAGTSKATLTDSASSGADDFIPADDEDFAVNAEELLDPEADPVVVEDAKDENDYVDVPSLGEEKQTPKKSTASSRKQGITLTPGLSRPVIRQTYTLNVPSADHRHRATPIHRHKSRVERLTQPPLLFDRCQIKATNNWTYNAVVTDRVNKASGYNVGWGPIWEFMEDRAWWKEAVSNEGEEEKDKYRRPRMHTSVRLQVGWKLLDSKTATLYLPSDGTMNVDGTTNASPTVSCHFGPFGDQKYKSMNMFDTFDMSELISESRTHVFDAGAPVWGLDWCPIFCEDLPGRFYKQYLAVAPLPSRSYSPTIGVKCQRPSHACIQIWSLSSTDSADGKEAKDIRTSERREEHIMSEFGEMKCEMVLCIENGPALEVKWCPLPSNDSWSKACDSSARKLGILAGAFEDGSLSIFAVPDPQDFLHHETAEWPIFVNMPEPLLCIELEDTSCWALDWANSEIIVVGCTNGFIAVYNIGEALASGSISHILPTHYIALHQAAIRAIQWIRAPPVSAEGLPQATKNPYMIVSGAYDGCAMLTNLREGSGNVMNRTRDVVNAVAFSPYAVGAISTDNENTVKIYSVCPNMLGRGHTLVDPGGPIWSLHCSDYHAQLAVGCADGSCITTNSLKSTRRGGVIPFFAHTVFQLDYNRQSGEFRMLEHLLPQETKDRIAASRAKRREKADEQSAAVNPVGTGAWPSQIAVQRVVWNTGGGLARAPLLASATGCGLCRVDWLMGRLLKNRQPYGGVEAVRRETDGDEPEDASDD